jgi:CrcB protein
MIGVALAFVVAAAAGALARAAVGKRLNRTFPWGTLTVNVSGSFALGLLAHASTFAATAFGTGLLGAYTTMSSFARDTVGLWEQNHRAPAALYVTASVVACVAGAWAGLAIVA